MYGSIQDEQQNRVLLLLTIVTTFFVPVQFLTGLWGMNFEHVGLGEKSQWAEPGSRSRSL